MINEPVKNDTNHPPSASEGGDNAYYLRGCEAVQRSPSYASCLWKIREIDAGRVTPMNSDCANAARCPAREMRQQEELAGHALFYFPRLNKPFVPVKQAGDFGILVTNLTDPALIPKQPKPTGTRFTTTVAKEKPIDPLDAELAAAGNGYADAITAAVADLAEPEPAAKPIPAPKQPEPAKVAAPAARPAMQPGETPLQYARRIAASRNHA